MCSKFLIAGTHSGSGKTTLTLGILSALKERGLKIQSFKAGPDFIDAGLHSLITARQSINLDLWMMGEEYVKELFSKYSEGMDAVIVEGVMGLFDGSPSTAGLASYLSLPVILVIDVYGMQESLRPVVRGYLAEAKDRGVELIGLIFNRTGGQGHYLKLMESIKDLGIEVFGHLPKDKDFMIPSRHLGLFRAEESPLSEETIKKLARAVTEFIDIDRLLKITECTCYIHQQYQPPEPGLKLHIAIARDIAFSFYYRDVLEGLKSFGAEIIEFSPLEDREIPEGVDFVYIGGGYPELYAERLSGNQSMISSIRRWAKEGRPLYAECGGLMYLSKGISIDNAFCPMVGIFPFSTRFRERPVLGYRLVEVEGSGVCCRGHEFHYSEIEGENLEYIERRFRVFNKEGSYLKDEGFLFKRTLATYVHIHNIMPVIKWLVEDIWKA